MKKGRKKPSIFQTNKSLPKPDPKQERGAPISRVLDYRGVPVSVDVMTGWDNSRAGDGLVPEEDAIEGYLSEYLPDYVVTHRRYGDNHGRGYALLWKKPVIHKRLGKKGVEIYGITIFSIRGSKSSPYVELAVCSPGADYRYIIFNYIEAKTFDYGWPESYKPRKNDDLVKLVRETLSAKKK